MPSARSSATAPPSPVPKPGARGGTTVAGISLPWQLAGLAVLFLTLAAALIFSGASAARQVSDPGELVRWGLPFAKAIHNVSVATVVGGLIFAVGILPKNLGGSRSREKDADAPEHPAFARAWQLLRQPAQLGLCPRWRSLYSLTQMSRGGRGSRETRSLRAPWSTS